MKLVIQTQYNENYGDLDNPHWKPKGGFTYELPINSQEEADQLAAEIMQLIEYNDGYQEEYIRETYVCGTLEKTCEDWESVHHIMPSGSSLSGWSVFYEYSTYSDEYVCAFVNYDLQEGGGKCSGVTKYLRKDGVVCYAGGESTGREMTDSQLKDYVAKYSEVA